MKKLIERKREIEEENLGKCRIEKYTAIASIFQLFTRPSDKFENIK